MSDPGPAEVAYLDVWTPEVAPRVERLRAQGTRVSCLGDLLLERWRGPTIGITGTAGKTTTTAWSRRSCTQRRDRRRGQPWVRAPATSGRPAICSSASSTRRRNRLDRSSARADELASRVHAPRAPRIAAVISFWPDHLELHGDLAAYRAAKETIVRHQRQATPSSSMRTTPPPASPPSPPPAGASSRSSIASSDGAYLDPTRRNRPRRAGERDGHRPSSGAPGHAAEKRRSRQLRSLPPPVRLADAVERWASAPSATPRWRAQAAGSPRRTPGRRRRHGRNSRKAAATLSALPGRAA